MTLPAYAMNASNFPEMYERWLVGPLFQPFAEIVLDRARLASGDRVLDVACGTGIVARLAMKRLTGTGQVVGVDMSPHMLAVARAAEPGIDWREGNASSLPLRDGERFDLVLCHQGLQFFPDKPAAVREMRRAMDRGGRLIVAVWRSLEETPFFRELHHVAERRLGAFVDRRHSFGDRRELDRLIADGGFEGIRVESLTRTIRFAESSMFVLLNPLEQQCRRRHERSVLHDDRRRARQAQGPHRRGCCRGVAAVYGRRRCGVRARRQPGDGSREVTASYLTSRLTGFADAFASCRRTSSMWRIFLLRMSSAIDVWQNSGSAPRLIWT